MRACLFIESVTSSIVTYDELPHQIPYPRPNCPDPTHGTGQALHLLLPGPIQRRRSLLQIAALGRRQESHALRPTRTSAAASGSLGGPSQIRGTDPAVRPVGDRRDPCPTGRWLQKKDLTPEILLAQDQEIQQLMARFEQTTPDGVAVQQLEVLVRTAIFKPANHLVGCLLQAAADRIDAAYQSKPGQQRKGRQTRQVQGLFGSFALTRDYYYHEGKKQGYCPADAALGLEEGYTPALARLLCLEGADETSYQKAQNHLGETGGIVVSARQIQRLVQQVGAAAQTWQEREAQQPLPDSKAVPIMYLSGDATGVPMRKEELEGRAGKQPDGTAKTRMAYLGCAFTQHERDEKGHPVRDHQSTTYVSTFASIEEFGPLLRQEAIRRGLALAMQVVLLIDGAAGLANMGRLCFPTAIQIVDFYHALEHAGKVLVALLG